MSQLQDGDLLLLNQVQTLVELERSLTEAMDLAAPWLPGGKARPLPSSSSTSTNTNTKSDAMSDDNDHDHDNNNTTDVYKILSVARNLSSRTSAPVGWNPQAPVIGFTTPNPMPHQLRGGALGALQLELARTQQKEAKREQLERKREREEAKRKEDETLAAAAAKRPSLLSQPPQQLLRQGSVTTAAAVAARQAQAQRPRQPAIVADMNLSDDDSSSSGTDED
ncbi:hypothetical protein MHU86_12792 [Fragilaria crotonensis]|nr:hypothetical protein MHU86_12792 [Fragilaria crotonensis]